MEVVKIAVLSVVAMAGILTTWIMAFRNHPGQILTWPMFSSVTFFLCNLHDDETGQQICLHREYPYGDIIGGEERLAETLAYLRARDQQISGTVTLISSRAPMKVIKIHGSDTGEPH